MDLLINRFNKIQSQYFPRWNIKHKWRIKEWGQSGAGCDYKEKLIRVSDINDELTIIHEICHGIVRTGGHGPLWQERFLKTADIALASGNSKLAEVIKSEVLRYQKQIEELGEIKMNSEYVSGLIRDAVYDAPKVSFEDIIKWLANEHGMLPEEVLMNWPKSAKQAFDQAHCDLKIIQKMVEEW